jgi:hypothetical protein
MTPKEKAEDLRSTFSDILFDEIEGYYQKNHIIKLCAKASVNELIKQELKTDDYYEIGSYWQQVKQEIYKL